MTLQRGRLALVVSLVVATSGGCRQKRESLAPPSPTRCCPAPSIAVQPRLFAAAAGPGPRLDEQIEQLTPWADWVDLGFGIRGGQLEALRRVLATLGARAVNAIAAWVARVEGRPDRVLTIKHRFGGVDARMPKLYFSALR